MYLWELLILAVGLSMDAFAVSVCKGLAIKNTRLSDNLLAGLWFGVFQGLMPVIGYFLGKNHSHLIENYDHWIAFILLGLIGLNMLLEALSKKEEKVSPGMGIKTMFAMAVATSIDALAVGITFSVVPVKIIDAGKNANVFLGALIITCITFVFSFCGISIGAKFGAKNRRIAQIAGGVILIGIGVKILLEHLGVM